MKKDEMKKMAIAGINKTLGYSDAALDAAIDNVLANGLPVGFVAERNGKKCYHEDGNFVMRDSNGNTLQIIPAEGKVLENAMLMYVCNRAITGVGTNK